MLHPAVEIIAYQRLLHHLRYYFYVYFDWAINMTVKCERVFIQLAPTLNIRPIENPCTPPYTQKRADRLDTAYGEAFPASPGGPRSKRGEQPTEEF